ncbi:MAG: type III-B CRISPR module-associated protein Cmr5 [Anaerolineae bacterium]|nr:type III-B CRISPR module-associated protein Cmr5 [Anaerolineae bacterium]
MSRQQTQEQRRAAQAWQDVENDVDRGCATEYKALASSAPADIQTSGLGQTLAFWHAKAKAKPEHEALYRHVSNWVMHELGEDGDLLNWITQADSRRYRHAMVEALAFLGWLKRFAQARF